MSISNEYIHKNNIKSLSINVRHLIYYIESMIRKDRRTMSDIYPIEMTEAQKDYIMGYLQKFYDDLTTETK
jgi:hypothetical protein